MYPIAGTMRRGFGADGKINLDLDGKIELDMRMDIKETTGTPCGRSTRETWPPGWTSKFPSTTSPATTRRRCR